MIERTLNIILSMGALVFIGILCSFFVLLGMIKQEFWNLVKENIQ